MLYFAIQTLTLEELKKLIANGDDNYRNQIRVTTDGILYLSRTVGAEQIQNLKFRYDTFDAGNNYVGKLASENDTYIKKLYRTLKYNWDNGRTGYIDTWNL